MAGFKLVQVMSTTAKYDKSSEQHYAPLKNFMFGTPGSHHVEPQRTHLHGSSSNKSSSSRFSNNEHDESSHSSGQDEEETNLSVHFAPEEEDDPAAASSSDGNSNEVPRPRMATVVCEVPNRLDLSGEEFRGTWYTAFELEWIKDTIQHHTELMANGTPELLDTLCYRGLETPGQEQKRVRNNVRSVHAVLCEQDKIKRQWQVWQDKTHGKGGNHTSYQDYTEERLAQVYQKHSYVCRWDSIQRAKQDEKDVAKLLSRQESKDMRHFLFGDGSLNASFAFTQDARREPRTSSGGSSIFGVSSNKAGVLLHGSPSHRSSGVHSWGGSTGGEKKPPPIPKTVQLVPISRLKHRIGYVVRRLGLPEKGDMTDRVHSAPAIALQKVVKRVTAAVTTTAPATIDAATPDDRRKSDGCMITDFGGKAERDSEREETV